MKYILIIAFVALFSTHSFAAVDCEMARSMAAGMSKDQLASMGTAEQRKQYAPCFQKHHKKKHRRS